MRAKLPTGDWLWPSVRLQPRFNAYGSWPRSGFVNILESRGNRRYVLISDPSVNAGAELASSSIIYGPHVGRRAEVKAEKFSKPEQGFDRDFHIYELEWTDGEIYNFDMTSMSNHTLTFIHFGHRSSFILC